MGGQPRPNFSSIHASFPFFPKRIPDHAQFHSNLGAPATKRRKCTGAVDDLSGRVVMQSHRAINRDWTLIGWTRCRSASALWTLDGKVAAAVGHQPQSDDREEERRRTGQHGNGASMIARLSAGLVPSISKRETSFLLGHGPWTNEALRRCIQQHPCCPNFHGRHLETLRLVELSFAEPCKAMQGYDPPTSRMRYSAGSFTGVTLIEPPPTPGSVIHGALAPCNFPPSFASGERDSGGCRRGG